MSQEVDIKQILVSNMPAVSAALERWLPRHVNSESEIHSIIGKQHYQIDVDALNKALFEPIWNLLDRGGKRWRSTLLLLIAESLGKKEEEVIDFVAITEIVHNGTLIVDDIEDDSEYRRGAPCLHKITGVDVAVNAGNFMYFLPLRVIDAFANRLPPQTLLECYQIYAQEMMNLHIGQGLDICWHSKKYQDTSKEPTVENYLQMCANKTGGLARMSAKLSALISGGNQEQIESFGEFAETVGVAFQIQDDILNLEETQLSVGKGGIGEDIHEGKRTIMVIHCFDTAPPAKVRRLKEILSMHTSDENLIREAIEIMRSNNSIEFASKKAEELMVNAWRKIDSLIPDSIAKLKLKALVDFLISRKV